VRGTVGIEPFRVAHWQADVSLMMNFFWATKFSIWPQSNQNLAWNFEEDRHNSAGIEIQAGVS
jgi:hypothetical protein